MSLFRKLHHRFRQMTEISHHIRADSKFLIIIFLMCFFAICISSHSNFLSEQGNMVTLRTLFSSLLGYVIENVSNKEGKKPTKKVQQSSRPIGFQAATTATPTSEKPQAKLKDDEADEEQIIEETLERVITLDDEMLSKEDQVDHLPTSQMELRTLLIGHLLMFLVASLILGTFLNADQNNQSLIVLKNTAFACVGFLISATKSHQSKQ